MGNGGSYNFCWSTWKKIHITERTERTTIDNKEPTTGTKGKIISRPYITQGGSVPCYPVGL